MLDEVDFLNQAISGAAFRLTIESENSKKSFFPDSEADRDPLEKMKVQLSRIRDARIREIRKAAARNGIEFSDEEIKKMA